jgi:hypothetical protein
VLLLPTCRSPVPEGVDQKTATERILEETIELAWLTSLLLVWFSL